MDGHVHYFSTPPTRTQSVTLGDEEARRRGVQKSVLERAAPPTFDVCVEMIERGKWRVHLDVAQARWREGGREGREGAVGRGTGKREGGRVGEEVEDAAGCAPGGQAADGLSLPSPCCPSPPFSQAVDALLAGGQPGGQLREKTSDGSIQKATVMPQRPGVVTRHITQASSRGWCVWGGDAAVARGPSGKRAMHTGIPGGCYRSTTGRSSSLDPSCLGHCASVALMCVPLCRTEVRMDRWMRAGGSGRDVARRSGSSGC